MDSGGAREDWAPAGAGTRQGEEQIPHRRPGTAIFGVQDRAKLLNLFEETNDFK
jgi:hypothetical protein